MTTTGLCITLDHIALNARPQDGFNQPTTAASSSTTPKRMFNAIVPLNSPPPIDVASAFGASTSNNGAPPDLNLPPEPPAKKTRTTKPKQAKTPAKPKQPTKTKVTRQSALATNMVLSKEAEEAEDAEDAET